MLTKIQKGFSSDEKKNFVIPGMLSANEQMDVAFENFVSPLESRGDYVKVVFKIETDLKTGDDDMRANFCNLT
jgi:hypothetical protein